VNCDQLQLANADLVDNIVDTQSMSDCFASVNLKEVADVVSSTLIEIQAGGLLDEIVHIRYAATGSEISINVQESGNADAPTVELTDSQLVDEIVDIGRAWEYYLGDAGTLCEPGNQITRMRNCRTAARFLDIRAREPWRGESDEFPSGCSFRFGDGDLYWNMAANGPTNEEFQPICRQQGPGAIGVKINVDMNLVGNARSAMLFLDDAQLVDDIVDADKIELTAIQTTATDIANAQCARLGNTISLSNGSELLDSPIDVDVVDETTGPSTIEVTLTSAANAYVAEYLLSKDETSQLFSGSWGEPWVFNVVEPVGQRLDCEQR